MDNEILRALHARKSVRVFTNEPVTAGERAAILEAAFQAPTAGNQQLYTILDITDPAQKARLADLCDHQPFIAKSETLPGVSGGLPPGGFVPTAPPGWNRPARPGRGIFCWRWRMPASRPRTP